MKISNNEIQKALKIKNAVQHYLDMTKEVNIRSTDVFPYLVRKGIYEADKNNGLFLRRFLKRLYKANMLKSLIPQCTYVPGINGEIFGEWYFNSIQQKVVDEKKESEIWDRRITEINDSLSYEDAKEILYQLIEGINPVTGQTIDREKEPTLFKIGRSLKVFVEYEGNEDDALTQVEVEEEKKPEKGNNPISNSHNDDQQRSKKTPAYCIDEIRKSHENAYRLWTPEEENVLIEFFEQGLTIKEIARRMKRQNGGVRSRLKKLGLKVK